MGTLMAYEEYASIVGGIVEVIQLGTKAEAVVIVSLYHIPLERNGINLSKLPALSCQPNMNLNGNTGKKEHDVNSKVCIT